MASKAKSGLSAVRQYWEDVVVPPNSFTVGQVNFTTTPGRDGKGHASIHAALTNDTAGTLIIFQAWQASGNYVQTDSIATIADPGGSGLQIADLMVPVRRRFFKVQFVGALGANFELGVYLMPRADSASASASAGGGGGGSPVANRAAFATGQTNVAVPLTPAQLPSQPVPNGFAVTIIAKKTNTKNIYLANSVANAKNHTIADILGPGDNRKLFITNWNLKFIDADVGGEGVTIISEI
jgi:hypothetical protein